MPSHVTLNINLISNAVRGSEKFEFELPLPAVSIVFGNFSLAEGLILRTIVFFFFFLMGSCGRSF